MLYNKDWDKLDSISQHLLRAADYIEEHGWCQNSFGTPDGKVCLQGALFKTRTDIASDIFADMRVQYHLIKHRNYSRELGTHHWNDDYFRTKDEVVALLREVAYIPVK